MRRRTFLHRSLMFGTGITLGTQGVGCSPAGPPLTSGTASPTAQRLSTAPGSSRVLLAYFSRAGENYYYGDRTFLQVGNTEVVANMIAEAIAVDVYRIDAADPYPESYDATVDRNRDEQDDDTRPAIAGPLPNVDNYDTVLLGSPIWNQQPPMIMRTLTENARLDGKTLIPFVTYAVSGLGSTVDVYQRLCPRSRIGDALAVRGEEAAGATAQVQDWLDRSGLRI